MHKFKVGDKVKLRYISLDDIWGTELLSKVGEIVHSSKGLEGIMLHKYDICFDNGDYYYKVHSDDQLRLINE